ncbi:hypothetical protein BH11PSE11_BH11PSE11_13780 [soil metagenome]
MKHLVLTGLTVALLSSTSAFAAVKVANRDSVSHNVTIKCSSSLNSNIAASSTRDVGKGPCTVIVLSTGSTATVNDNETLIIKDGKFAK